MLANSMSQQPCCNAENLEFDMQISHVQFSTQKLQQLRDETNGDAEMEALKSIIITGWPETRRQLPSLLRPYWSFRDEMSVEDGIILKGDRIVIPLKARPGILAKLHESNHGIDKTRLRASCVYWVNLNADIEDIIKKCSACQQEQQLPESFIQHEIPTRAWQVIGTDLFSIDRDY